MNKIVSIVVLILAAAGAGYVSWSKSEQERQLYPAEISVKTRPGAAVLIPFSRKLTGDEIDFASAIYGVAHTDPHPLAGNISVVRSGVYFQNSGAVGDMLIWAPANITGRAHFSLSVSGEASVAGAGRVSLQSEGVNVTLQVAGPPVPQGKPKLAGSWSDSERQWRFAADGSNRLTIKRADYNSALDYSLYPDQNGRWFMVEIEAEQPRLYWLEMGGDKLMVSLPGPEFKPFAELRRSGA